MEFFIWNVNENAHESEQHSYKGLFHKKIKIIQNATNYKNIFLNKKFSWNINILY